MVFVHGATYPAHTAFDLKLGGLSWMEYIASHGYDHALLTFAKRDDVTTTLERYAERCRVLGATAMAVGVAALALGGVLIAQRLLRHRKTVGTLNTPAKFSALWKSPPSATSRATCNSKSSGIAASRFNRAFRIPSQQFWKR